jgi:hypothetical protein
MKIMEIKKELRRLIASNEAALAVYTTELAAYTASGIKPLLDLVLSGADLTGAYAADRVVGRAAALLFARAGVRYVYAALLSETAVEILTAHKIEYEHGTIVPVIKNRPGTDMCPMEKLCKGICAPAEAVEALRNGVYGKGNS